MRWMKRKKWRDDELNIYALMDMHGFSSDMKDFLWMLIQRYIDVANVERVSNSMLRNVFLASCIILGVPVSFDYIASLSMLCHPSRNLRCKVKKMLGMLGYESYIQRMFELEIRGCCKFYLYIDPFSDNCNKIVDFVTRFIERYSSELHHYTYRCLAIYVCRLLRRAGVVRFCLAPLYTCTNRKVYSKMEEFLEEYLKIKSTQATV